jgi:hypothetical protein
MGLAGLPNVQYNNKQYILWKQMGIQAMVSWKFMQYGRMENCYFFTSLSKWGYSWTTEAKDEARRWQL